MISRSTSGLVLGILFSGAAGPVLAQDDSEKPWVLFIDDQSTSQCDVVNADNAELVVIQGTGVMVIVSGTDVTLADLVVDAQGFVEFDGEPAGVLDFYEDGDGFRSLWWTSLTGEVVRFNGFTGAPTFTTKTPEDYRDAACDACDFWDDQAVCETPVPTIPLCGMNVPLFASLSAMGLMGAKLRRRRGPT
jgi:hypothetical protein